MLKKKKYLDGSRMESLSAHYNMLIGERSNGKSYLVWEKILKNFIEKGEQGAYLRRWDDDFKGQTGEDIPKFLEYNGNNENMVSKLSKGKWDKIVFKSRKWYLSGTAFDDKGKEYRYTEPEPFCHAFSLTSMEHDKSKSYPKITTILFDEFMARYGYIRDEFILFCNVISTIVRDRTNVTIYMCGNTISKFCPYFTEMGLTHIWDMKPGDIELYTYNNGTHEKLRVCVWFTDAKTHKESNVYFAFDNPKLKMITGGDGSPWELDIFPHNPTHFTQRDILFIYFINFSGMTFQCEIVFKDDMYFTFIHRKTSPMKAGVYDLIYQINSSPYPNVRNNILMPYDDIGRKILWFYRNNKVFYQDNEVGNIIQNFLESNRK